MMDSFKNILDKGLDLLYPQSLYCICCGNLIDSTRTYNLCDHCMEHFRWDGSDIKCSDGLKMLRCTRYGIYERTLIFDLKYNGKKYIARDIAQIMADRIALAEIDFDVIVPVPMFWKKEQARGFNQAALIGKHMGKITDRPCMAHALIRTEETAPMRGLGPTERKQNVKGKFALREKCGKMLKGKKILLIDDFYTTGSTAKECSLALKAAEPEDVYFLAFAAR